MGHKGNGFVKFKDVEVVKRLIESCKSIREGLEAKDFMDLELQGRQLDFIPALQKGDKKLRLKERKEEAAVKKEKRFKRNIQNSKTLNHLIQVDKNNKRNIQLIKLGLSSITKVKSTSSLLCFSSIRICQRRKNPSV